MRWMNGSPIWKSVGVSILLLTCGLAEATVPKPNPGNQATAILVQKLLQDHHFAGKPLTEEKAREWIRAYMEALDYNHAFFLESDLKAYQDNYAPQLAKLTQRGDITPAYEIFSGFNDRVRERLDWIKRRLTLPFDFSSEQTYEIDRTRVGWPADLAAAEELWERRLKFDLLREKLVTQTASQTAKAEKKKEEDPLTTVTKRYDRLLKNLEDYDNEEISQLYLTALASLYDPHSSYMSPSTLEDFSIGIKLALVGIGAVLSSEDGYCIIKELVPGGPADLDGRLKVGDKIVGVAQGEGHFEDIPSSRKARLLQAPISGINSKAGSKASRTPKPIWPRWKFQGKSRMCGGSVSSISPAFTAKWAARTPPPAATGPPPAPPQRMWNSSSNN